MKAYSKVNILLIMCIMVIGFMTACGGDATTSDTEGKVAENKPAPVASEYNKVVVGGIAFNVPDYYGENTGNDDQLFYAERGQNLVMLNIAKMDLEMSDDEFATSYHELFKGLYDGLENSDGISDFSSDDPEIANTSAGIKSAVGGAQFLMTTDNTTATIDEYILLLNNPDTGTIVMAMLGQSKDSAYDYFEQFAKMVDSAEIESAGEDPSDNTIGDKDFDQLMADYEEYFDRFIEISEDYKKNPSDSQIASDYMKFMSQYMTVMQEFENLDQSEWTDDQIAKYIEVQTRINSKMLEALQ